MKILALDYGDKRIGIAIGETESRVAVPYGMIENSGRNAVLHALKEYIRIEDVQQILIGLPFALRRGNTDDGIRLSDVVNEQMRKVLLFVDDVRNVITLPVETIDERLSTREAERRMRGIPAHARAQKDALAAAIILQNYFDVYYPIHSPPQP